MVTEVVYAREHHLDLQDYCALLEASTLAERRPMDDPQRLAMALNHTDLILTARHNGLLIGAARSVTDFSLCCYIADLAVDKAFQGQGIGQRLLDETRKHVHSAAKVFLISAPGAVTFYEKIGLERLPQVFNIPA